MRQYLTPTIVGILLLTLLVLAGIYFIPWKNVTWGKIEMLPGQTITVTGEAKTQQKNQVAIYTAGVHAADDNKDKALSDVNQKMTALIAAVKQFGVKDEDVRTQNVSIYKNEKTPYGPQMPEWNVDNSINITLRDITKASALADMLASSGATNVYGPNFTLDDTRATQAGLLKEAVADAQKKAEQIAVSSDKKVGQMLSVTEGSQAVGVYPMARMGAGGGGGAPTEPGSGEVTANVTVVFELK